VSHARARAVVAEIKNEELKVKQSIKQAAKRGDMGTAKLLAKEIVRSRKAVARLHTSKAQMNSVVMQMQNQMGSCRAPRFSPSLTPPSLSPSAPRPSALRPPQRRPSADCMSLDACATAQQKVMGHLAKSTQVMSAMNNLVKVGDIRETMQGMQREMMKAGIIEEMVDDAMEALDDEDDEDAADEEVEKVMQELNAATFADSSSAPTAQVQVQQQETQQEEDGAEEEMRAR